MKLTRNRDYLFLVVAVVLITAFVVLAIIVTFGEIGSGQRSVVQPVIESETRPKVKYEKGSLGKSLIKLTSRTPLSPADLSVKQSLVNFASENSGLISKSDLYTIEYISAIDDIEVEILTTDIDQAKTQAVAYLQSRGLSEQGMCNLPVRFYLNYVVTKEISPSTVFNPLPPGC